MIVDGIVTNASDVSCTRPQEACHDKIDPRSVCRRGYDDLCFLLATAGFGRRGDISQRNVLLKLDGQGRGSGIGRGLGVGLTRLGGGSPVGVDVAVAVAVGVGVAVAVGVAAGVAVAVAVAVGVGVALGAAGTMAYA